MTSMSKRLGVLIGLLLGTGLLYAMGPVPGSDNMITTSIRSGSNYVNIENANFRMINGGNELFKITHVSDGTGSVTMSDAAASDGTAGFLNVTGTLPGSGTEAVGGVFSISSSNGASVSQRALDVNLLPGNTSAIGTSGIYVINSSAGIGGLQIFNDGNYGIISYASGGGKNNNGLYAVGSGATADNYGVMGGASGGTRSVGGYFWSATGTAHVGVVGSLAGDIAIVNTAALFDNGALAAPIAIFRDNGAALPTTGATATWSILDGAIPQYGLGVLTSATMAAGTQAYQTQSTSSYTWTNAQVVALGASLTGDITVATLPAKTQVLDAAIVITGQAAGVTTLTVSCGDANGGTPFITYIVPSDAKAAVNTFYGDAVGERGTALDVEHYYLPSYTATTLVTCHFISTVQNLDQTTGSTGRVILTTRLLP